MDMHIDTQALQANLANTPSSAPHITTMPVAPAPKHRKRTIMIVSAIVLILGIGFANYWFFLRDTGITEQDKLDILEDLKKASSADFTQEAKEEIIANIAKVNSEATNLTEEEKMNILNSLGGTPQ